MTPLLSGIGQKRVATPKTNEKKFNSKQYILYQKSNWFIDPVDRTKRRMPPNKEIKCKDSRWKFNTWFEVTDERNILWSTQLSWRLVIGLWEYDSQFLQLCLE